MEEWEEEEKQNNEEKSKSRDERECNKEQLFITNSPFSTKIRE
jgi:hypothetical protein